ncbi:MAG: LysM peptidoglycan-binding domain-containing protein [Parcubacteria group bacterium]|nr:LysM peptidoglycan-binding domain-containing protein [Parcubacteria group bacterium]
MKRIMQIMFILSVLVLAAASANAAVYTVKKGDTLSKIGQMYSLTWQVIAKANADKVKNPDKIYVGQKLAIPERGKKAVATAKPKVSVIKIKKLGAHKFGPRRDPVKAIKKFELPQEVKDALIAELKAGRFSWATLKKGDRREQMAFGNYRITGGKGTVLEMDFPEGHKEAVRRYSVEHEGWIFHLEIPLKCDNPTWWKEKIPTPPPPAPKPEPAPEIVPVPPPPEPKKPKQKFLLMRIPPPVQIVAPPALEILEAPPEKVFGPDVDISVGSFADWHKSGNNPRGIWGVGNFYSHNISDGDRLHSFGFALEGNYWNGVTGDEPHGFHYLGNRYAIGPAYRLLTADMEFQVRAGLGEVNDWGHVKTDPAGEFKSSQTSTIMTAYAGLEKKRSGTPWLNRIRYSGQTDIDIHRSDKSDRWIDGKGKSWPLNGKASSKNMYSLGVDASIYKLNNIVSLAGGASATHYQEGQKTGLRLGPGLDFYAANMPIGGLRFNLTHWSDSDHSIGLGGFLDLSNLIKHLFPNLLPKRTFGGEEWKQEEIDQESQEKIIQDLLR